ncbi:C2 domain, partial [Dillenia turbinata]
MSESSIQGQELQIMVVGCNNLKDKKWFKKQNPYVCLDYGQAKYQTGTCEGGGTTPSFQAQYNFALIEGLRELNVSVWGRNTFSADDFIGSVSVHLQKVLSEGYDDRSWSLRSKTGMHSGEVRLIMHHSALQQSATERPYNAQAPCQFQPPNNLRRARSGHLESMATYPPYPAANHSSAPPTPQWTNAPRPYASEHRPDRTNFSRKFLDIFGTSMMSISGIQGQTLEVTVVGCHNLKDKEWTSRQDPYVCVDYGAAKFQTRTCTDGGKNPTFQEKFVFSLIEGLGELNVLVWNSHTLQADDLIGCGKIQLHKVLSRGYDDNAWPIHDRSGRHSGDVRLILYYPNANQSKTKFGGAVPQPYGYAAVAPGAANQLLPYNGGQPTPATPCPMATPYPPTQVNYPATYPPSSTYPPPPPAGYPAFGWPPSTYPPQLYPPAPQISPYYPP